MFKGAKSIAVVLVLITVFAALALSGCMPMGGESVEGGAPDSSGGLMAFLPLVLIIAVFYFILIRPQNKKNKQVSEMRNAIKRGDWITTIGGFRGRVVRVKDDDIITIEVGADKIKLDIMRWGISKIDEAAPAKKAAKELREEKKVEEEAEEEKPKRMPKKLSSAPKKEKEPEEEEPEDDDYEDEDDDE
ncbi:MAG: preprotein translocase subunit YajC [Clostridiales bacterium]|nr:preprotein translocase subunit YajC [Clostridiales bacterium]